MTDSPWASAAVLVEAHLDLEAVAELDERRHVRELLSVDDGVAQRVVLRPVHAQPTALPACGRCALL